MENARTAQEQARSNVAASQEFEQFRSSFEALFLPHLLNADATTLFQQCIPKLSNFLAAKHVVGSDGAQHMDGRRPAARARLQFADAP